MGHFSVEGSSIEENRILSIGYVIFVKICFPIKTSYLPILFLHVYYS